MLPEESPEAKFDRLKKQLQDAILRDYPNPERHGCSGETALRQLAAKPLEEDIESDSHWNHVTHCSECYREFLAFNNAVRVRKKERASRIRSASVVATVLLIFASLFALSRSFRRLERPQNAELAYVKHTVNIESVQRSGSGAELKPIVLERSRLELTVELPVGSKAGRYEVQFKKNDRTLLQTGSEAHIRGGVTAFTVMTNLTSFEPGEYSIVVRQVPFDWNYYPVVIR